MLRRKNAALDEVPGCASGSGAARREAAARCKPRSIQDWPAPAGAPSAPLLTRRMRTHRGNAPPCARRSKS